MPIRITTLSDNTAAMRRGLLAEHGFSVYLDAEGTRLLFDTGQSISAAHNAKQLGIDLSAVPVALSHGHYDHTGGLAGILEKTGQRKVFCHPDAFSAKYIDMHGMIRPIGIPESREDLMRLGADFDISTQARQIGEGIWLTGEIPRITDYEKPENYLLVMDPIKRVDALRDDQALVLETKSGLLIILGCAHAGLINTIEHAKKITGEEEIAGIVGGTHLGFPGGDKSVGKIRLNKTIKALKRYDIRLLAVSHCTGQEAAATFFREYGDSFVFNNAGTFLEL
jgi:7,8-dihydropterin-6-yl-methyl-4-(beta-D-ribofuranosyl)aminobenzene 5'-phosphate synthase